ncbi:hypothetical protein BpHYR1_014517 [Brachionus plicatilis]|uniref:Uncharacterized protein n=1 Tax=Brachionus plicatilis TaxID=10195 RepID=A0A3M7SG59_BRAPC|nr:hypothetical protein BpHYR1_014517 [Brachionus plicatilis]
MVSISSNDSFWSSFRIVAFMYFNNSDINGKSSWSTRSIALSFSAVMKLASAPFSKRILFEKFNFLPLISSC